MTKYVSVAEVNTNLGLSGEDTLVTALILTAEAMVDKYVWMSLESNASYSEELPFPGNMYNWWVKYGREIYLRGINPHWTLVIDGTTISGSDYRISGQKLTLKDAVTFNTTFPHTNTYAYTSGYSPIPDAVKWACYRIVGYLYAKKSATGIDSFRQDALSVTYSKDNPLADMFDSKKGGEIALLLAPYKLLNLNATGIDRSTIPWIY